MFNYRITSTEASRTDLATLHDLNLLRCDATSTSCSSRLGSRGTTSSRSAASIARCRLRGGRSRTRRGARGSCSGGSFLGGGFGLVSGFLDKSSFGTALIRLQYFNENQPKIRNTLTRTNRHGRTT